MAKEKKSAALSLKHGGGVVMAWLPVETTGVYGCTQTNTAKLTDQHFTVQMVSHPKHAAKATQEFLKVKKWDILK